MSEYITIQDQTGNIQLLKVTETLQAIFKRGTMIKLDKLNDTYFLQVINPPNSGLMEQTYMHFSQPTMAAVYLVLKQHYSMKNYQIDDLNKLCKHDNQKIPFEAEGYDIELAKKGLKNETHVFISEDNNGLFTEIAKKYYQ